MSKYFGRQVLGDSLGCNLGGQLMKQPPVQLEKNGAMAGKFMALDGPQVMASAIH